MRTLLISIMAFACIGATDRAGVGALKAEGSPAPGDGISALDQSLAEKGTVVIGDEELQQRQEYLRQVCRDRIEEAREANGQPPLLEREPASPDEAYAIYAVDRRQDGCGVMVMMGDPDDIRPLPAPMEGPLLRVIPAQAGQ